MAAKTAWLSLLIVLVSVYHANADRRNVLVGTPRSGDELVATVLSDCVDGEVSAMTCVRAKVLQYLDSVLGAPRGRALLVDSDDELDAEIGDRVARVFNDAEFSARLPFGNALLRIRPGKGVQDLRITFPDDAQQGRAVRQARGLLKKKLLLPALLLLKLKLKALMPLFVAIIGAKALKALVLSKLAVLLVVGFLIVQLCKKAGMMMPMAMNMGMTNGMDAMAAAMMGQYGAPAPTPSNQYGVPAQPPTNQYGVPAQPPTNQYGVPSQPPNNQYGAPAQPPNNQYGAPAQPPNNQYGAPITSTASSYDPNSWAPVDSSSSGSSNNAVISGAPYPRWDAHNIAYSSYQPQDQSPSASSSSSTSSSSTQT